jgi:hypothetical protein
VASLVEVARKGLASAFAGPSLYVIRKEDC